MAELGWRPREVLGTLVDVYLNLSACEPFTKAVAGDERSYKRQVSWFAVVQVLIYILFAFCLVRFSFCVLHHIYCGW